uniref:Carboxypeptidase n=1 Tax=Cryptomeria japonica TaxID=3369 RepID=A0A1V1FP54_CRYJA|nr:serine carboxypeptidase [Cryptomeria japonica]
MDPRLKMGTNLLFFQLGIVLLIVSGSLGAPRSDLVKKLPGQPKDVSFNQYAGYVTINADKALFYYFVEADTDRPTSRPLALWLTGGPGCSSLGFGALEEHGPFRPKGDILVKDLYSWNKETNVLYVESPIGVGFSYSNNTKDYQNFNDAQAAEDNLAFILNWYKKFPEFKDVDFYITGESYAGHYVPQLTALVLDYNKNHRKPINLKGISLGNPFVDIDISINNGEFLWSHGQISDRTYKFTRKVCNTSRQWYEIYGNDTLSADCAKVSAMVDMEMGSVDPYDAISDDCVSYRRMQSSTLQNKVSRFFKKIPQKGVDPCIDAEVHTYLNRKDVQKALHANTSGRLPGPWDSCYGPLGYDSRDRLINIIPILSNLLKAGVRVILYGGDQDSVVPFMATRTIADRLAKELHLSTIIPYRTWYDHKQIAGWTQAYGHARKNGKNNTILTFATVRGAAHEVPYTNPSEALTLYRSFIRGLPLPLPTM